MSEVGTGDDWLQPRLLLDTHIVVRLLSDPRKLSREQGRLLEAAVRRVEPLALSDISLLEIGILVGEGKLSLKADLGEFFARLQAHPLLRILPITCGIAEDIAVLGPLRDSMDRAIVATARVHALRLVTSDQRIVE